MTNRLSKVRDDEALSNGELRSDMMEPMPISRFCHTTCIKAGARVRCNRHIFFTLSPIMSYTSEREATSILYRTPWRPPVAVSAEGMYFDLEDGRRVIDAVGGSAVSCIGNGHPKVVQALKDQLDKVACMYKSQFSF